MSRRNRNNREVVDADVEEVQVDQTETEPSVRDERPAEEVAEKSGGLLAFAKKHPKALLISGGVIAATLAFFGGRKAGVDMAYSDFISDNLAEDENSEGSDGDSDDSSEEETNEE